MKSMGEHRSLFMSPPVEKVGLQVGTRKHLTTLIPFRSLSHENRPKEISAVVTR